MGEKKEDSKDTDAGTEEAADDEKKDESKEATKKKIVKSEKCIPIDGRKIPFCAKDKYFGQNSFGFEIPTVAEAFNKLYTEVWPLVKTMGVAIPPSCIPTLKTEMCGIFFPSCSRDCQERKAFKSSCLRIRNNCCSDLVDMLKVVQPGGAFHGFAKSMFADEGMYTVVQTVLSQLKCDGENLGDNEDTCATVLNAKDSCKVMAVGKRRLFPSHEKVKVVDLEFRRL